MSHARPFVLAGTMLVLVACNDTLIPTTAIPISVTDASVVAWVTKAPMPTPRAWHRSAVVGGQLYVIGGNSFGTSVATNEAYNPVSNTWSTKAPAPVRRYDAAIGVINGLIYVAGGCDLTCIAITYASMDAYDPVTNTWSPRAPMGTARFDVASGVINGKLYVVGGQNGPQTITYNVTEEYNPVTDSWTAKAPWPNPRNNLTGAAVLNNKLYIVGGFPPPQLQTVDVYDPATDSWANAAPMPSATMCCGTTTAFNGKLYYLGGFEFSTGELASVLVYDPTTNAWSSGTVPNMPAARSRMTAQEISGVLYATGGGGGGSAQGTTFALEGVVAPNTPPVANAGADQTLNCVAVPTAVTLDGSGSTDDVSIASYQWAEGATNIGSGPSPAVSFGAGVHTVVLTVTDNVGATDVDTVVITVNPDVTAPTVSLGVSQSVLWPPNHQMVPVATVSTADACDASPLLAVSVTSSEPINGTGDGDTAPDWIITNNGDGTYSVSVRAERKGNGSGRVYTITATATDAAGNASTSTGSVKVPKSQGKP